MNMIGGHGNRKCEIMRACGCSTSTHMLHDHSGIDVGIGRRPSKAGTAMTTLGVVTVIVRGESRLLQNLS